jgi:hypothetical protein
MNGRGLGKVSTLPGAVGVCERVGEVMRRILLANLALLGVLFAPLAAEAVPLLPGTTLDHPTYLPGGANPDYTLGHPGWFDPLNAIATLVSPYTFEPFPPFIGTLTSTVYAEPTTGHLGFEYVWTNTTPGATVDLIVTTVGGENDPFLGVDIVDAGSDTSGLSTDDVGFTPPWTDGSPNLLERASAAAGANVTVQWLSASVGTVIRNPTDYSARVWLITDEKTYSIGTASMQDSGRIASAQALVPTIPEPATLSLLGLGLLAVARRRRR